MPVDVFLSVGRTSTLAQEQFVRAVENCLREQDLSPRSLGRTEWSAAQPLTAIRERMQECSGTVVLAFERLFVTAGVERRGSDNEEEIRGRGLATVWNQIEAAMAYTLDRPLLVIVEKGLRSDGLLESRYDWAVQWLPLEPDALRTEECLGIISDWKRRVLDYNSRRQVQGQTAPEETDLEKMTIGEILGQLRPGQARTLILGVIGTLTAVAGTAFTLGVKLS